jgi:urease accessory protein
MPAGDPLLRLMHLVSPALPVGAFTYSQGIEWAVETGWIRTANDLEAWLGDQLDHAIAAVDLPLLARMSSAVRVRDAEAMSHWIDCLTASRETSELRAEEANRGRALVDLLVAWDLVGAQPILSGPSVTMEQGGLANDAGSERQRWKSALARSQAAGFAYAAAAWNIPGRETLLGYAWGWLENLVLAGVKAVPLGQTQGQRILQRLSERIPAAVDLALSLGDEDIGASSPALAIASAAHETQYTRLFRS